MAEPTQYTFAHPEVVEALLKQQGIHEGTWAVYLEFGLQAGNAEVVGAGQALPIAILAVQKIGIQRVEPGAKMPGVVDAAKVNPKA